MRAQIAIHEVQLQAMRSYATANNPDLKARRNRVGRTARPVGQDWNATRRAWVMAIIAIPTRQLPQADLEYIRRARDLKYHEALYDFLGKQMEAARIDEANDAVTGAGGGSGREPEKKSGPETHCSSCWYQPLRLSCWRVWECSCWKHCGVSNRTPGHAPGWLSCEIRCGSHPRRHDKLCPARTPQV